MIFNNIKNFQTALIEIEKYTPPKGRRMFSNEFKKAAVAYYLTASKKDRSFMRSVLSNAMIAYWIRQDKDNLFDVKTESTYCVSRRVATTSISIAAKLEQQKSKLLELKDLVQFCESFGLSVEITNKTKLGIN